MRFPLRSLQLLFSGLLRDIKQVKTQKKAIPVASGRILAARSKLRTSQSCIPGDSTVSYEHVNGSQRTLIKTGHITTIIRDMESAVLAISCFQTELLRAWHPQIDDSDYDTISYWQLRTLEAEIEIRHLKNKLNGIMKGTGAAQQT